MARKKKRLDAFRSKPDGRNQTWFDRLTPAEQKVICAEVDHYMQGHYPSIRNVTELSRAMHEAGVLPQAVSGQTLRRWIREEGMK